MKADKEKETDIYRSSRWPAEYKRRLENANLSKANRKTVDEYFAYLDKKTLRVPTLRCYLSTCVNLGRYLGPQGKAFEDLTPKDMSKALSDLTFENRDKRAKIVRTKWFMDWVLRNKLPTKAKAKLRFEELFDKDNIPIPKREIIRDPENVRTWAENVAFAEAAPNSFWRSFIFFLADSGTRIGEALSMQVRDIVKEPNNNGVLFRVSGRGIDGKKTPHSVRTMPLERTGKLILDYVENRCPNRTKPTAPLWCKPDGTAYTETSCLMMFGRIRDKIGSTKPCNPHSFRWASMSDKAARWPQQVVLRYHGECPNSQSLKHYIAINQNQVQAVAWKIPTAENKIEEVIEGQCHWCLTKNPINHLSCTVCGRSLKPDIEGILKEKEHQVNTAVHDEAQRLGISDSEALVTMLQAAIAWKKKQPITIPTPQNTPQ